MNSEKDFAVGHFDGRVEVLVTGRWTGEAAELFLSGEADRLVLNYAHGFTEPDLEFLKGLPIRQLVVLDRQLPSLEPLLSLSTTLELLHLTSDPKLEVDLAQFPQLRELSIDWHQVRSTISHANKIENLNLGRFAEPDLSPLTSLRRIWRLSLTDRPRLQSLSGLTELPEL